MLRRSAIPTLPEWYTQLLWADWPLYLLAAEHGSIAFLNDVLASYRIHDRGAWSGLTEATQIEQVIDFYGQMNVNLDFRYDGVIQVMIERHRAKLARVAHEG